jgi:hypothetical protein
MKPLGSIGHICGLAFALALSLAPCAAEALDLAAAEKACKAHVIQTLPDPATVANAVRMIRLVAEGPANPCRPDLAAAPVTREELNRVAAEIARREDAYQCRELPTLPVCLGLTAAADRARHLPALGGPDTPARQYRWQADFHWNITYGAFGNGPGGVSLLKLVLIAADQPQAAGAVTPATDFAAFAVPAADCTVACRRATAEVLGLYAILTELDWFYQKNVASPEWAEQAKEASLVSAKWDAYLFGGGNSRVQLPWELLLNSAIYTSQNRDRPLGEFPTPPNYALVLLHPSVGLSLKDAKGADSNLVGVVELLGLSRWSYNETTGAREGEWGLSAVAAYQPRDNGKDWGYGGLVRTPWRGLNIVWTRTDLDVGHDDQFLFSVDPSSFLPSLGRGACLFKLPSCKE